MCARAWRRLYGSDRGHGRANGPGQAQRWRGQQEAAAAMRAQPSGKLAEIPDLAQIHTELEQTMLVQRQGRTGSWMRERRMRFHRIVVRDQGCKPGVGDPLQ